MSKVETESVAPLFVAFDLDHPKVPPCHKNVCQLMVKQGRANASLQPWPEGKTTEHHSTPLCQYLPKTPANAEKVYMSDCHESLRYTPYSGETLEIDMFF